MAQGREVAEVDLTNSGSTVNETVSYVLTDYLGSVDDVHGCTSAAGGRKPGAAVITDHNGPPVADMSFGAGGNRREPATWVPPGGASETQADHAADRYGFTHQEMLDDVQGSTSVAGGRKPGAAKHRTEQVAMVAYFTPCRLGISRHGGHPFHVMAAADFTARQPPL